MSVFDYLGIYNVINHKGNWLGTFLDKFWMNKERLTIERDLNLWPPDWRAGALPTKLPVTSPILEVSLFCQYLCEGGASQKSFKSGGRRFKSRSCKFVLVHPKFRNLFHWFYFTRLTDSFHKYALRNIRCRTNRYSRSFIPNNVELWNSLDNMIYLIIWLIPFYFLDCLNLCLFLVHSFFHVLWVYLGSRALYTLYFTCVLPCVLYVTCVLI